MPMAHLPFWYQRCAIHVNLTPKGFGDKVAWEAMACARPCLVANEGFRATLGKYAECLLFRHGDADDLAKRLLTLLEFSLTEREQMGHYLRDQVIHMHSMDRLAECLVEVFREVQACHS
jgi:glycosyltransferase involved in cell wall biosynthesis